MDYRPNIAETGRWMRTSDDLRGVCRDAAQEVADVAVAIAPIDTGAYIESIQVVEMSALDRVAAGVMADDPAAAPLEFGNTATGGRSHNILSRAAEIAGLDLAGP